MAVFRVRPFRVDIDGEQIAGEVVGDAFVLRAYGTEIPLAAASLGTDGQGVYADVLEGDIDVAPDFRVHCEIEPDEFTQSLGGQIAIELGGGVRERTERIARAAGYDPERYTILARRADRSRAVYFDSDGGVNGTGHGEPLPSAQPN